MTENNDEYEVVRRRVKKKQRKTSNVVLAVLGFFIFLFIAAMVVTYWKFQDVPNVLIQYVLGAGGLEVLLLAGITVAKVWAGRDDTKEGGS